MVNDAAPIQREHECQTYVPQDTHGRTTELGRTDKGYREKRYPKASVEPSYTLFPKNLRCQSWDSYGHT